MKYFFFLFIECEKYEKYYEEVNKDASGAWWGGSENILIDG